MILLAWLDQEKYFIFFACAYEYYLVMRGIYTYEVMAIVGASGSGKTTLLNRIVGYKMNKGSSFRTFQLSLFQKSAENMS